MKRTIAHFLGQVLGVVLIAGGGLVLSGQQTSKPTADWPQFRGPAAAGVADGHALPTRWNVPKKENVRWSVEVPGLAHSSPIISGNTVCVTTAVAVGKEEALKVGLYGDIAPVDDATPVSWEVHCFDKSKGTKRWSAVAHKGIPRVKRHPKSTHASSTLATDGRHVIAMFGSEGLYAYDMNGKLLWKKDLGLLVSGFFQVPSATWGFASSPIIHRDRVIVQADVLEGSFLAAFDVETGKDIWRTPRTDYPTWSTPAVHTASGRSQIIVNGFKHVGGYDLQTGKELWRMKGGGDIPVPTPISKGDLVFITNAHGPAAPIFAVKANASGDISLDAGSTTNAHVVWSQQREGGYMQTPIIYGDYLYVCRDNGVLTVFEANSGKRVYQQRLADGRTGFSASAVAGDGKIYYTSEEGTVFVVKPGPTFEQLAENELGETAMATPAISDGVLYFRSRTRLVAVAE